MTASSLQFLADGLPHMVWVLRADGSAAYVNQPWIDYSGLSRSQSQALGQAGRWLDFLHSDDRARSAELWQASLEKGSMCRLECRLKRADGAYRWMLAQVLPYAKAPIQAASGGRVDAADGPGAQWIVSFTDIDDLKRAADRLEQNHAIYRIAGRVAQLGGWTIDLPTRKLTWSDENCAIHDAPPGYEPRLEEGISYFYPEDRPVVIEHVQACIEHGRPYEFILPKRTLKGRHIWVRSIGEAVRDASGTIVRIQGAFQDITEQKAAEARTLALQTQLHTTLESITDGFYLLGKDWRFVYLNGPAEHMLQRRREALLGQDFWEAFPLVVGSAMERKYRAAVQLQAKAHFESYYGHLGAWFDVHVYPTEAGLAVYFQDITQRRAEHAQLHLLQAAVSRLNDLVVISEVTSSVAPRPRIVFVNEAFERCTGYTSQEAIGKTADLLLGQDTHAIELKRIRNAMDALQPVRAEIVVSTKAGKPLWLETDITPIADTSGKHTHWVAVMRDVSERKQQQREIISLNTALEERVLLRTAQLARANKELESFAYSVSHDLRSPLNTVHGFSQLLAKNEAQLSAKGLHYLDRIGVGVKQMGELIEGLLTLANLSRDEMKTDKVDLSALARGIEQEFREREPERQAEVHIQEGMSALGDHRLLGAALRNLFGNAWKFTSRQGHTRIDLGAQPGTGGELVFFVRDNGAGYDSAFEHKLFGTFERLHSPDDFAGTGIGLATVKRIVERHGGRIWAQSTLDQGATFFFTLKGSADPTQADSRA
jgi:PAS domain S-box-containing protein